MAIRYDFLLPPSFDSSIMCWEFSRSMFDFQSEFIESSPNLKRFFEPNRFHVKIELISNWHLQNYKFKLPVKTSTKSIMIIFCFSKIAITKLIRLNFWLARLSSMKFDFPYKLRAICPFKQLIAKFYANYIWGYKQVVMY